MRWHSCRAISISPHITVSLTRSTTRLRRSRKASVLSGWMEKCGLLITKAGGFHRSLGEDSDRTAVQFCRAIERGSCCRKHRHMISLKVSGLSGSYTELPSSTHLRCLLIALLDVPPCTPASALRRRLGAPSNATWY